MADKDPVLFLFPGEGAHSSTTDLSVLKCSPSWGAVEDAVKAVVAEGSLDAFLTSNLGCHKAPMSPVVTTVINILNADSWRLWGVVPTVALGHSVGEVASAYVAGLLSIRAAIETAFKLGQAAATIEGRMVHTILPKDELASFPRDGLCVASINHPVMPTSVSVSLCGSAAAVAQFVAERPDSSVELKPEHPWHSPAYAESAATLVGGIPEREAGLSETSCVFVSCTKAAVVAGVNASHWAEWLSSPLDFAAALECAASAATNGGFKGKLCVVELGAHPVMAGAVASVSKVHPSFQAVVHASSMRRGVPGPAHIKHQRGVLRKAEGGVFFSGPTIADAALTLKGGAKVLRDVPFADQGITSAQHPLLAAALRSYFPGIGPHDFYRYTSLQMLCAEWDSASSSLLSVTASVVGSSPAAALEVLGISFKLPPNLETTVDVWEALVRGDIAIGDPRPGFKGLPAGYLNPPFDGAAARAAAQVCGLSGAEATAMDPQHALALGLAAKMWDDAGPRASELAKKDLSRVGVYIGAWQPPASAPQSAYRVLGNSLSALASRVANSYGITGPAITVNTACSSSLVALDAAMSDARLGRIDFAIVGGVNLVSTSPEAAEVFSDLKRAGMLSPTARCHTFSDAADGYVRSEGGCLFLLKSSTLVNGEADELPCRARIVGSAVNQNSPRRPLTAVDPISQERVIRAACADAGVTPAALSAVEMHGTGTRLGDPVECSALAAALADDSDPRKNEPCFLTAAKMHFGHLESAAGALGLLKAVLMLERRMVPGFKVDAPGMNPNVVNAMGDARLALPPTGGAKLPDDALIGVSSFGFAGNNAHIVVQAVPQARSLPVAASKAPEASAVPPPAPKPVAKPTSTLSNTESKTAPPSSSDSSTTDDAAAVAAFVWTKCVDIIGDFSGGAAASMPSGDTNMLDLGLDSLGLAELVNQLELRFGDNCVAIETVLAEPTLDGVVAQLLKQGAAEQSAAAAAAAVLALPEQAASQVVMDASTAISVVWKACVEVIGDDAPANANPDAVLMDLGLDSLGLAELVNQLELLYGEGCITIEDVLGDATLRQVAAKLAGVKSQAPITVAQIDVAASVNGLAAFATDVGVGENDGCDDGDWIRTTHVGSLPRQLPDNTIGTVESIVAKQLATGLSFINDGESSRENYVSDALSRCGGIGDGIHMTGCLCEMPLARDMKDVPMYSARFTGSNGIITLNPKRPAMNNMACVAPPSYVSDGEARLAESLEPFLTAIEKAGRDPKECFWSVPSPGTLAMFCENRCAEMKDDAAYVHAFGNALKKEYETIAKTGLVLQVDCPDLAMGCHTRHSGLSDEEFINGIATMNMEALNIALENVPKEQVRIHICWGNYAGPHHKDLAVDKIWPLIGKIKAKFILVEAANPRHVHEVAAFERAVSRGDFTRDQVIVPGVIDTTAARVEHPEAIAQRLLAFVRAAGHPSRVMAGTDCGFASTAKSVAITADIAWRKLASLVEGAQLATRKYLELQAPVPVVTPKFNATVFRCAVLSTASDAPEVRAYAAHVARALGERAAFTDVFELEGASNGEAAKAFEGLRWAVDSPMAVVGIGGGGAAVAKAVRQLLADDKSLSRRPSFLFAELLGNKSSEDGEFDLAPCDRDPEAIAKFVAQRMSSGLGFDKRRLVLESRPADIAYPAQENKELVVVVGAGLLGLMAGKRLLDEGFDVAILEQRALVGGIWSMYANSTSQVNSSEGGYCLKEFLPEDFDGRHDNRDHSTAAEILTDLEVLAKSLQEHIYTGITVAKVLGDGGDYTVIAQHFGAKVPAIIKARGVVMAINDRVGLPRPLPRTGAEVFEAAGGVVCDGTGDSTSGMDWIGKEVVIFGMGAFAIENVRTALEGGAKMVTVVARRHGTICPKIIDYLNFVKPWECVKGEFKHDVGTNVKQFGCWKKLYASSGATVPECWPGKVKHDGHTISVSDIWFVGHRLGKLTTRVGQFANLEEGGVVLNDGSKLAADVVIGCIGFERSSFLAEHLTDRSDLSHSNYLDKDMMYLADAEIDEGAFNSFYGSSVLEYGKFWTKVYVEGLKRSDELGSLLWGSDVSYTPIKLRKWSQYIASAATLISTDTTLEKAAWDLVNNRTDHFMRTMPPKAFVQANKREWQELHTRLNGGVPVPLADQLPYFFNEAPAWCE